MRSLWTLLLLWLSLLCLPQGALAQSVWELEECGVSYIDPQDDIGNTEPAQDTLVYTTFFDDDTTLRAYYVDINAFGGSQVDRARVLALMPDGSQKELGSIAFGNCIGCVEGFALVDEDSLLVQSVSDENTMNLWLQSLGQPPYALTGNLQTLVGVGRLSGTLPFCAAGLRVEFVVFSNPASTSTEFATHIHCPEAVGSCPIEKEVVVDCIMDSISLRAVLPTDCFSGPVEVQWSNDSGWETTEAVAQLPLSGNEGMYYLRVDDGCCLFLDSVLVENPDFAEAGPDDVVCEDTEILLQGSGGVDYFWELPGGDMADGAIFSQPNAQASDDGLYILHAFNEEGCEDTDTLQLTVNIPPEPLLSLQEVCLGDTLLLGLSNDTAFAELRWQGPAGNSIPNGILPGFQPSDIGLYSLQALDSLGCEKQLQFEVSGFELPEVEAIFEPSCDSTRVYLVPPDYQFSWETGIAGPVVASASGGSFEVSITDANGCTSVRTFLLPPPDGPDVEVVIQPPLCPGDFGAIYFNAADPSQALIYSIDGGQSYEVYSNFEGLPAGGYELAVQDDLGCVREFTAELSRPDTLVVSLNIDYLEVRPNQPVSLSTEVIGNIQQYQWLPKEIDTGGPGTTFLSSNNMDVRIIVEDDRGCKASDGFQLTIVLGDIYVPNAFSPNEDGTNQRFTFYSDNGSGEIIESLKVFNRWGGLLYEGESLFLNDEATGWDGKAGDEPMPPGVYTYHGIVRFGNGVRKSFKGDITLVR